MTIISRVSIRRPVKEVWTFFDNPANLPLWRKKYLITTER